jgi:hypothetical protein
MAPARADGLGTSAFEGTVGLFRIAIVIGALSAATATCWVPVARAAGSPDGSLDPSHNPLIGTWLLSAELVNPNLPIRCHADRIEFTPTTQTGIYQSVSSPASARYVGAGPKIAVWGNYGYKLYTVIDNDHIMLDEIPRCTWQRGQLGGQTAMLRKLAAERGETASAQTAATPPQSSLADNPDVRRAMEELERSAAEIERFVKEQDAPK